VSIIDDDSEHPVGLEKTRASDNLFASCLYRSIRSTNLQIAFFRYAQRAHGGQLLARLSSNPA